MRTIWGAFALSLCAGGAIASEVCTIDTDVTTTFEMQERSLILVQYEDVVVRAASGKVRCEEDSAGGRLICSMANPAELLIDHPDRPLTALIFHTDMESEAHISAGGDTSCGS